MKENISYRRSSKGQGKYPRYPGDGCNLTRVPASKNPDLAMFCLIDLGTRWQNTSIIIINAPFNSLGLFDMYSKPNCPC